MSYKAEDIAGYVLRKCIKDGKPISHLQLQRILYHLQKEFLWIEMSLFDEDIEAWEFGPCVPSVYQEYCTFGGLPIYETWWVSGNKDFKFDSPSHQRIVDYEVEKNRDNRDWWQKTNDIRTYGIPWMETRKKIYNKYSNRVIKKELIKEKGAD